MSGLLNTVRENCIFWLLRTARSLVLPKLNCFCWWNKWVVGCKIHDSFWCESVEQRLLYRSKHYNGSFRGEDFWRIHLSISENISPAYKAKWAPFKMLLALFYWSFGVQSLISKCFKMFEFMWLQIWIKESKSTFKYSIFFSDRNESEMFSTFAAFSFVKHCQQWKECCQLNAF